MCMVKATSLRLSIFLYKDNDSCERLFLSCKGMEKDDTHMLSTFGYRIDIQSKGVLYQANYILSNGCIWKNGEYNQKEFAL